MTRVALAGPMHDEALPYDHSHPQGDAMSLADQKCVPCKGGVPPMDQDRAQELLQELEEGWHLNADGHLERTYSFSSFVDAMAFANRVGDIAFHGERFGSAMGIRQGNCLQQRFGVRVAG